jgi:hypothetical protein
MGSKAATKAKIVLPEKGKTKESPLKKMQRAIPASFNNNNQSGESFFIEDLFDSAFL